MAQKNIRGKSISRNAQQKLPLISGSCRQKSNVTRLSGKSKYSQNPYESPQKIKRVQPNKPRSERYSKNRQKSSVTRNLIDPTEITILVQKDSPKDGNSLEESKSPQSTNDYLILAKECEFTSISEKYLSKIRSCFSVKEASFVHEIATEDGLCKVLLVS